MRIVNGLSLLVLTRFFLLEEKTFLRPTKASIFYFFGVFLLLFLSAAVNAAICPEYKGRGLDYTITENQERLVPIARTHFTKDVRLLRKGATGYIINDLEYMLNWSPNHHQVLDSLTRLALREGTTLPRNAKIDLECRFLWAEQTQPRDAMVPVIQGIYYYRAGKPEEAKKYLEKAAKLASENPEVNYNLGLALYRMEDYEKARYYARKAYKGGYPLPGLRNMLEGAGYPLSD